jgi:hypothetical protein
MKRMKKNKKCLKEFDRELKKINQRTRWMGLMMGKP